MAEDPGALFFTVRGRRAFRPQPGEQRTFRYDWASCPSCGVMMNAATVPETLLPRGVNGPSDGSYTVCVECAEPAKFVVAMGVVTMQPLPAEELAEFMRHHGAFLAELKQMDRAQKKRLL